MNSHAADEEPTQGDTSAKGSQAYQHIGTGLILGASLGLALNALYFDSLVHAGVYFIPLAALFGAAIALTRLRKLLWLMNALALIALAIIAYTPLMPHLMRGLQRSDPPGQAPAVVVLSNVVYRDGTLNSVFHDRVLHALEILQQGQAGTLVLTRPGGPIPEPNTAIRTEMRSLRIDFPVEEVGPVATTHDEAIAVAALARQHGWDHIILVTQSWHMRRAAAVFEKAGVNVICSPCPERSYDLQALARPGDRLHAFGDWMHETIGYQFYRWRNWV